MSADPGQARSIFDQYAHMIPPLALAILGGVVKTLLGRRQGCSPWRLLADTAINCVVAFFTGAIILLCLQAVDWNMGVKGGIVGLSGLLGADLLKVMASRWLDTVKKCDLPGGGK